VIVFGLAVIIVLVVIGAQLILKLMERLPWLVVAGGGILGFLAGEIATADAAFRPWIDANAPSLHYWAPAVGVAVVVAAGVGLVRRNRSMAGR
jgi:predicted tellurium resistance membrane protein TerC